MMPFLFSGKILASGIAGGEITNRCLGSGKYEVTLKVIRDCSGNQLAADTLLATCGTNTIKTAISNKVSQRDVTGIGENCSDTSKCKGGSFPYGFEEHVWKTEIDLSGYQCCEWILSWESCCRSSAITTGSANQGFYISAMVNNCLSACNSSPIFTNPSLAIMCVNKEYGRYFGAIDTNDQGDSLSYHLVAGMQNANQQISYSGSFSPVRPLTFWGFPNNGLSFPLGLTLNPATGDLLFRPTQVNQVAVVAVEAKEWRSINGKRQVIGTTRRDMPMITFSCPENKPPKIKPPYSVSTYPGQHICIRIDTEDEDSNDTVKIAWNKGIVGAFFTNNNGHVKKASGEVCWTPNASHSSNIPYTFTITAIDNGCPNPASTDKVFSFLVKYIPETELAIEQLPCGLLRLNHILKRNYGEVRTNWEIRDTSKKVVFRSSSVKDSVVLLPGVYAIKLIIAVSPMVVAYYDTVLITSYTTNMQTINISQSRDSLIADTGFWEYSWFDEKDSLLQQGSSHVLRINSTGKFYVKATDSLRCNQIVSPIFIATTLSVQNINPIKALKVYPNPCEAGKVFVVESDSRIKAIFDSMGRSVKAEVIYKSEKSEVKIDNSGVYIINMEDGNNVRVILY